MRALRAVGIALALSWLSFACGGSVTGGDDENITDTSPVTMSGIVYANVTVNAGCPNGCFSNPLPGAQVSTSLDANSVTTHSGGKFALLTATQSPNNCAEWMVVITAEGYTPYRVTGAWGNHSKDRNFALFPPLPTQVARC